MAAAGARRFDATDLALLIDADPELFDAPVLKGPAHRFLSDPAQHFVGYLAEGALVAFASATEVPHPDCETPELFINQLSTLPAHRRRGYATACIEVLRRGAAARGTQSAWLATGGDNTGARALYRGLPGAFETRGIVMFDLWSGP